MNRRLFITTAAQGMALTSIVGATPCIAGAHRQMQNFWLKDRSLDLRRASTGESFNVVFWSGGQVIWKNYVLLCYLLRDVTDGNHTVEMDVGLLNLLYGLQEWARLLGHRQPQIIAHSGLRTPRHNATTEGAAHDSEHLYGRAADVTMASVALKDLAAMATFFEAGGVGRYDQFLHVDVGRVRQWNGKSFKKQ